MAFTAKILSWRFHHLNIVGCLLKRRPTKGGSRAPQDPPPSSYAPDKQTKGLQLASLLSEEEKELLPKGDVTRNDLQRRCLAQHRDAMLEQS